MIRSQLQLFFLALGFLTRLPVPPDPSFSQDKLNRCVRYFPLVGLLVGAITGGVTLALTTVLQVPVAVLLGMIASLRLTGAFHEDGLADSIDGLGGGLDPDRALDIMKDSRLGTYGACALIGSLSLKWLMLSYVFGADAKLGFAIMLFAHCVSRLAPLWIMRTLPYAGDRGSSKSKPLAKALRFSDLVIAHLSCLPAVLVVGFRPCWISIPCSIALVVWWRSILKKKIQGYTGDTLGAAQQFVELGIYLIALSR